MQHKPIRALLLAISVLLLAAFPVAAADADDGWRFSNEDESVLVVAQQDVVVGPGEAMESLVILDGTAVVEGVVESVFAVDADIAVSGATAEVERIFTIGGSLTVDDGASLGDVTFTGTELDEAAVEASATGEVVNAQDELVAALGAIVALLILVIFFLIIGAFIASLAVTLLVVAWGTAQTRRAAATISHDVLKTIVAGLLMLVVPSILISILFATIVGIPLALGLAVLWGIVLFLGQVVVAVWIGERILPRARSAARPYGAAFLGMLILLLLSWTGVVPLLAGIFGSGAVTLAGWRVLRGGGMPPVPPGYGQPYGQPMQVAPPPYAPPPYAPPPGPQAPQGGWPPQGGQPPASWPQG